MRCDPGSASHGKTSTVSGDRHAWWALRCSPELDLNGARPGLPYPNPDRTSGAISNRAALQSPVLRLDVAGFRSLDACRCRHGVPERSVCCVGIASGSVASCRCLVAAPCTSSTPGSFRRWMRARPPHRPRRSNLLGVVTAISTAVLKIHQRSSLKLLKNDNGSAENGRASPSIRSPCDNVRSRGGPMGDA